MSELGSSGISEDVLDDVSNIETVFDAIKLLKKVTCEFEFSAFSLISMPKHDVHSLGQETLISSWPRALLEKYDRQKFIQSSPIVNYLSTNTRPSSFKLETLAAGRKNDQEERECLSLFSEYDISFTACIPVHDVFGNRFSFLFLGNMERFKTEDLAVLTLICTHVFDRVSNILNTAEKHDFELTDKELSILRWIADGKTSFEIGSIMSLSEHTVNAYAATATKKLDTTNRTQAVIKAVRLRIID